MLPDTNRRMVAVLTSAVLCFASGCAVTGFSSISLWPVLDVPPHGEVTEVMALWSDGIVVMPDPDPRNHGRPAPGFNGRILLYGPSHKEPLAADGTITVYLYDITHQPDPPVPLEVWTIDPANLRRVARKDSLGWGYNLWLPWSTCNPEVRRVSLVVKYTPHEGMERFSGHTKMTVNDESGLRPPSQLEVSGTSMTPTGASVGGTSQPSVRASTIAVPRSSSLSRLVEDAGKAPPAR